jgi:hypothetical protein
MKVEVINKFDVPAERLEKILFDERLPELLKARMSTMLDIQPLSKNANGALLEREVKYFPKPMIASVAGKKVEPEWMVFTEKTRYDFGAHKGTFQNVPQHHKIAGLLLNHGELIIKATGPNSCEQVVKTEIKVKVPIVGMIAERIIGDNGKKILEEQAAVVREIIKNNELA